MTRWVIHTLKAVVALALIWLLWSRAGIEVLPRALHDLRSGWLAIGALLVPIAIGIRSYNLSLLVNARNDLLGQAALFRLTLIGIGLNLFLPAGASDLAKAAVAYKRHGSPEDLIVSTVLDKVTAITALAAMGAVGAALSSEWVLSGISVVVLLLSLVPFVFPHRVPWRWLVRLLASGHDINEERLAESARPSGPLLFRVVAVSAAGWVVTYAVVYVCCMAVGAEVSAWYVLALAPLTTLAKLIPISAGGVGLGEFTMAFLLEQAGVGQELATRASLLALVLLTLVPGVVGLGLWLIDRPRL
ncbi:MAG: hypothetical protein Kow0056_08640 [Coriobacteriia bacterium]